MVRSKRPSVVLMVKFKSGLAEDEAREQYQRRMPEFRALPGLVQKYYVYEPSTGEWSGIYLFDSEESVESYLSSDLRRSIPAAYRAQGTPRLERFRILDTLFDEEPD